MTPEHLDAAVELSRNVKWPHRRNDWELVLSISNGIAVLDGERLVATTMMTPFGGDVATINMVIVDAAMRGRGLGRRLMEEALAQAGKRTCYLVATTEGLPLYEKLGFVAIGKIAQHQGHALPVKSPNSVAWSEVGDFARIMNLDRAAKGYDRSALMQRLHRDARFAVRLEKGEEQAFAAVRVFGRGFVIGPVVARDDAEAKDLIDFLLAHHQGEFVRIDTDTSTNLAEWFLGRGLNQVDEGTAMRRSGSKHNDYKSAGYRTYALVTQAVG